MGTIPLTWYTSTKATIWVLGTVTGNIITSGEVITITNRNTTFFPNTNLSCWTLLGYTLAITANVTRGAVFWSKTLRVLYARSILF